MSIETGFALEPLTLPLASLLASRKLPANLKEQAKYRQIQASIEAIGLIEPLSVSGPLPESGQYLLLDGHVRLLALQELGHEEAPCLPALDDESYTYNNRINRLSPVQEHHMLRRAVERGVSPERLAQALSVDARTITRKLTLLRGICPEAVDLLKDRQFTPEIARFLRRMKPARQIECADLMLSANKVTVSYARAMLAATPPEMQAQGRRRKAAGAASPEQLARMDQEMANLQSRFRQAEKAYGADVLNLVIARGYLAKLLGNPTVRGYLSDEQPDMLAGFELIVSASNLDAVEVPEAHESVSSPVAAI